MNSITMDQINFLKTIAQACDITDVPESFTNDYYQTWFEINGEKMKEIQTIDLSLKKLQILPSEIQYLENLQTLNLSKNNLQTLPKEIAMLKLLKLVQLHFNPIDSLPREVGSTENLRFELQDKPSGGFGSQTLLSEYNHIKAQTLYEFLSLSSQEKDQVYVNLNLLNQELFNSVHGEQDWSGETKDSQIRFGKDHIFESQNRLEEAIAKLAPTPFTCALL